MKWKKEESRYAALNSLEVQLHKKRDSMTDKMIHSLQQNVLMANGTKGERKIPMHQILRRFLGWSEGSAHQ